MEMFVAGKVIHKLEVFVAEKIHLSMGCSIHKWWILVSPWKIRGSVRWENIINGELINGELQYTNHQLKQKTMVN